MSKTKAPATQPAPAEPISPDHAVVVSNNIPLTTHTGFEFHVRPVEPSDKEALAEFFTRVSRNDSLLCFLSPIPEVRASLLNDLVNVDHDHKADYLAFDIDDKAIVASAMVGAYDDKSDVEVSIVVRSDYKRRGMSLTLLRYVIEQTRQSGIKKFQSIESRQHHAAIEHEKEMSFSARSFPGDSTFMLPEFDLGTHPSAG